MKLTLISVPYDSALRNVRMGTGPDHLIGAGLTDRLVALRHTVETETIQHEMAPPTEIRTGFELMRGVAIEVNLAVRAGRFPIVLSGNCNAAIGTLAGLGENIGVGWFDAHGDFNTPETTTSGFLDGTGLATLVGRCWQGLAATVPGFHPVPEANVVLAGVRDLDPPERAALEASSVTVLPPSALRRGGAELRLALDAMARRVHGTYLHLDPMWWTPPTAALMPTLYQGGLAPPNCRRRWKR